MNIIWKQENGVLAITEMLIDASPEEYAVALKETGGIPQAWIAVAYNVEWPNTDWEHEAHRWINGSIVVSKQAAIELTMERIRREREPLLATLDIQQLRNLESGTDSTTLIAEKNRLRNLTEGLDKLSLSQLRNLSV